MLIHEMLEGHVKKDPAKEAIAFRAERVTYEDYLYNVNSVAAGMVKLGVRRGDKVALYLSNRPEYVYCYIAATSIGAMAVPVSTRFGPEEVRFVVSNSNSRFLVVQPEFGGVDFLDVVNGIIPGCPDLETIVVLGSAEEAARVHAAYDRDSLFVRDDAGAVQKMFAVRNEVEQDDPAFMVYTSGTTGVPKGAVLTHKNLVSYVRGQIEASGVTSDDRLLLDIPVNHVGGGVMAILSMLYTGGTLVILDAFVPQEVLKTVQDERISVLGQVPAQYILMMMVPEIDEYDLSSVKLAVVAAAPSPRELFGQAKEKFGVYLTNGFGLSEVSGAVTFTRVDEDSYERLSTSVGRPNPGIEIAIKDPDGADLPVGEEGEICIRGDAVMKGYYNMPEETALVMTDDGYFRTGDMGTLDADGYLYILGRKKEMYIRGGENVYPPEVEDVLQQNPKVLFSAVIGVSDPVMGEVGRAYIVPQPGGEPPTEEEIKEWCAGRLAKFKVPAEVVFREALPLTPLGKVMKKELYRELEE